MKSNNKIIKTNISILVAAVMYAISTNEVFAQTCRRNGQYGIDTALGCIPFGNQNILTQALFGLVLGISGGVAFLLLIYSGFIVMTAQGDRKRLEAGKELLTASFSGLALVILSVFFLKLIGVNVLQVLQ